MASLSLSAWEAAHRRRQQLDLKYFPFTQARGWPEPAVGLVFGGWGRECIEYAFFCTSDFPVISATALPHASAATLSA